MTPGEWQAIRQVLESALDLTAEKRPAYLESACVDEAMRREVESLLAAHDEADTNLLQVAPALRVPEQEALYRLAPGKHVGPYRVVEEIAEGGMGAVYRAVRDDGAYSQEVAIKIVRAELGSALGSSRFRNERQILATLDHPNIARILDGGTTSEGIPYLVMELIDGIPITAYCDQQRLDLVARVCLFRAVCAAVQFAHQRLVIHRDIKPSNILVTRQGVPKLLDFGIAKILDPLAIPDGGSLTVAGASLLTPEYASPEQLTGGPMTTATDVYSLGCVLYELLSGQRALRLASRLPHEIARAVLEADPEKPSAAASHASSAPQVAAARSESPRRLRRSLQGDLDNIVMRAIRKEPAARYESVNQLSEDLRRHLAAEPVLARRSTLAYRVGRFVSRHKVAVGATTAVLATVVMAFFITLDQAKVARASELRAKERFDEVRKLANSLIFEIHDSIRPLTGATAARKLLLEHAQEYLEKLSRDAGDDPALLGELAAAYTRLGTIQAGGNDSNVGNIETALANYRKAMALLQSATALRPADHKLARQLAGSYYRVATALDVTGDVAGRKDYVRRSVQALESLAAADPADADVQRDLGIAYGRAARFLRGDGDLEGARANYLKAHATLERLHDAHPDDDSYARELSHSHRHLGTFLALQRDYPPALEHYRAAAALDAGQLARDPKGLEARFNATLSASAIAFVLGEQGDVDGALRQYREALATREALAAADPADNRARTAVAESQEYIGVNLARKRDYSAALESFHKALVTWQEFQQRDPVNRQYAFETAWTQADIGQVYAALALDRGASSSERLQFCRQSHDWYARALPTWLEGQKEAKLGVGAPEALTELRQNIDACDRLLARRPHIASR